MKHHEEFLLSYLKNTSPVGYESEGQKIWLEYLKPYIDEYFTDNYGTAVGVINPGKSYKVVIEAHADEIAWVVNYINSDGFLYVKSLGGSDAITAISQRVNIHSKNGMVKGVFGWPAIHVRRDKGIEIKDDNLFVDCGCTSREEVEKLGIRVGTVITYDADPFFMNENVLVSRALDNRIGGFMISQVARKLREENIELPFTLYIVNSVQEEVGLRGAQMIAYNIKPDVALVTDVCHCTKAPHYNKINTGDTTLNNGPVITISPQVQAGVREMLLNLAEEHKIQYQLEVASRSTGTDTDSFAYSRAGVPSALLSLPLRYMHTTVETIDMRDLWKVVDWMYLFVKNLQANTDFRVLK